MDQEVEITSEKRGDVLILHLSGRFDALSTPIAEKKIIEFINTGNQYLLFDFSNIDYISSAGMRLLLSTTKKLKAISGKLVLCCVMTNVMDVFKMSGFDHVLDLSLTEEEALQKFSK